MDTIMPVNSKYFLKDGFMPNIIIEAAKLTKENKNDLIRTLTRIASEVTKIPETSYTVLIKEFPIENWGIGGEPLEELMKRKMNS